MLFKQFLSSSSPTLFQVSVLFVLLQSQALFSESFPKSLSRTKFCCWWWLFSFYEGLNYLEEAFETGHFMIKLSSKRFGPYIFHSQLGILSALRLFNKILSMKYFSLFSIWPTSTKTHNLDPGVDAIKHYKLSRGGK